MKKGFLLKLKDKCIRCLKRTTSRTEPNFVFLFYACVNSFIYSSVTAFDGKQAQIN